MPGLARKVFQKMGPHRKAGLPPGTLLHIGEVKVEKTKITMIDYDAKEYRETEAKTIDDCFSYIDKDTVTWINIDGLHEPTVIERLGNRLGIHPLVLEDVLHTGQRPKMEDFEGYLFVVFKMLQYDENLNEIIGEQISLIVGPNYVISFQEREGDIFNPIRGRIKNGKGRIRRAGADYLAYALLDTIVDHYFVILEALGEEIEALEQELAEKRTQLAEANRKELEFLKKQRELEEKAEALDLEVERKLAAERKKIAEEAGAKATEEQLLKLREKDDKIDSLTKTINDLKRKAEQGSQESQGEALEGALQDLLQQTFPFDRFEEVKKGQRGADILQVVHNPAGKECGKILWESKNAKEFSNKWVEKLKGDQQDAGAEIAVIASVALPKDIRGFALYESIWLTDFASCAGLATALRLALINAAREKALAANQDTLKDVIYKYVTGQEFAMQIRAIADAFIRMKEELDREKRATERMWKSREKQLETVISNIAGIRGSLEGYLGPKALPPTDQFALDEGTPEDQE